MRWILHPFPIPIDRVVVCEVQVRLYRCVCDNKFGVSRHRVSYKSTSHIYAAYVGADTLMCDSYFSFEADAYAISRRLFDSPGRTKTEDQVSSQKVKLPVFLVFVKKMTARDKVKRVFEIYYGYVLISQFNSRQCIAPMVLNDRFWVNFKANFSNR